MHFFFLPLQCSERRLSMQQSQFLLWQDTPQSVYMEIFLLSYSNEITLYNFYKINQQMANRFEYNFTRQSEYEELKERNMELEEQNSILKQSLEELIKVNTELTESIEELNNNGGGNFNQQYSEDIENKLEMLINENQNLREMVEHQNQISNQQQEMPNEEETQSLVNILEELTSSFKNIEIKYEEEINQLQQNLEEKINELEDKLSRVEQELQGRINTIEALSIQLKRKDETLEHIMAKMQQLEREPKSSKMLNQSKSPDSDEVRVLERRLDHINKELEDKNRVISLYASLLNTLKGKIMQKV